MTESQFKKSIVPEQDLDVLDDPVGSGFPAGETVARSNPARSAKLLVAFVCMALLGLHIWLVVVARTHEVAQLTLANEKLAASIAQHVDSSLLDVEHILDDTVFSLEQSELALSTLERLQPKLVQKAAKVEQLNGLLIYDASGRWLVTSEAITIGSQNNADREYFIFHRDNPSREAHLGLPLLSRSTGVWVIPLSRRLNDADGNFAGVALATMKLEYFTKIVSRFKLGDQGATALALDGRLLTRAPFNKNDIGRDVRRQPAMQKAARQTSGTSEETSTIDGVVRIISFDRALNFPVVAVVAVGRDEALRDWLRASGVQTAVVIGLCGLVIFGGLSVLGAFGRREFAEERLRLARDALAAANEKLARLARDDGLTGIPNRRYFNSRLAKLFGHAQRNQRLLAVVMVDVDNFKNFNDRYGHVAGDECLKRVAAAVTSAVRRPEDFVARYGGEELAILLPDTDSQGAFQVAERARLLVQAMQIPNEGSVYGVVTISLGVAVLSPTPEDVSLSLVVKADRALYEAKEAGRNRSAG
jgi:diguanylate cyclase (GGDEF)-like protein